MPGRTAVIVDIKKISSNSGETPLASVSSKYAEPPTPTTAQLHSASLQNCKSTSFLKKNYLQSSLTFSSATYQAIIMHSSDYYDGSLDCLTSNYPLALVPIVNKPIICYQLEYLLLHGISDIMVTVDKRHAGKIERYLKNYMNQQVKEKMKASNIELVVLADEEEAGDVLRALDKKIT